MLNIYTIIHILIQFNIYIYIYIYIYINRNKEAEKQRKSINKTNRTKAWFDFHITYSKV